MKLHIFNWNKRVMRGFSFDNKMSDKDLSLCDLFFRNEELEHEQ